MSRHHSDSFGRLRARTAKFHSQMFYYGEVLANGYMRVDADGKVYLSAGGGLLPDMTGETGKVLFTNGTIPYWGALTGGGDMAKAVYDIGDNGVVDVAAAIAGTPGNSKVYTTSGAGSQQWDSQGTAFNKSFGTGATDVSAGNHTHSGYLLITDIDDVAVDGVVNAPISSNWAYDHLNASNPHGVDAADIAAVTPTGKFLRDDGSWQPTITDVSGKLDANVAIVAGTKTKITYDVDGLVTSGADATTGDIADSSDKRYVSDAHITLLGNTSGANTGDETTTTIKTKLGAAATGADGYLTSVDWNAFDGKADANHDHDLDYSALGHTHLMSEVTDLPVFGDAVTYDIGTSAGTLAEGNHNHNLDNLTEKSYNSLTDKPTIPAAVTLAAERLAGRYSSTSGTIEEIQIGANLSLDGDTLNAGAGATVSWGAILGTLAEQLDLQDALDDKSDISHSHNLLSLDEKSYNSLTDKPTIPDENDLIAKATLLAHSIIVAVSAATPVVLEVPTMTLVGRLGADITSIGIDTDLSSVSANDDTVPTAKAVKTITDALITKALLDANTILGATSDNTPVALTAAQVVTLIKDSFTYYFKVQITDDATAVTTGDNKYIWIVESFFNGFNLVSVELVCTTVSSSGTPEVQLRNVTDSQDMLSTKVTIDANEYTSATATTAAVINATYDDIATGDRIAIDVDGAGTGTKGLAIIIGLLKP